MSWQTTLTHALLAEVSKGTIPSLSLALWVDGEEAFAFTGGIAQRAPVRRAVRGQVYDLASVTKVLAGVGVAAALVDRGVLDLDASVSLTLPDVDPRITARQLLSHSAGYPPWAPLYERVSNWGAPQTRQAILRLAREADLVYAPGQGHRYSDLGYLTLCALLEQLGDSRLDDLFSRLVLSPLGDPKLTWGADGSAAATEDCPVRHRIVVGEVHDLNTFAMGGVSTHAGLFGSASNVARLADSFRQTAENDPTSAMARFIAYPGPGSHRLGWDGISAGYTSTGQFFPADTVGHLGYTGTSVWIAPCRKTTVVLLTNRVHPTDDLTAIRSARPRIHDAVARALGWDRTSP